MRFHIYLFFHFASGTKGRGELIDTFLSFLLEKNSSGRQLFFNQPSPAQFYRPPSLGTCVHDLGWDVDTDQDQRRKICGKRSPPPNKSPRLLAERISKTTMGGFIASFPPPSDRAMSEIVLALSSHPLLRTCLSDADQKKKSPFW